MTIDINGVPFTLLHEKALYRPDEQLLVIADVHLGKATHFRKAGIPMPANSQLGDYTNLRNIFRKIQPASVYFLGDLFHSSINKDWDEFCDLIAEFASIQFTLVKGNHDLIHRSKYREVCMEVIDEIEDDRFVYTHEPRGEVAAGKVNISGHIHPGIVLAGAGRQSIKLPCFYVSPVQVIVPAFGLLTGLYPMERTRDAAVYAVLTGEVRKV